MKKLASIPVLAALALLVASPAQATHAIDLGAYVQQQGSETQVQAFQRFEAAGGELDLTRHYLNTWDGAEDFTWTFIRWSAAQPDQHPYISLHTHNDPAVDWSDVAKGLHDAFLTQFATEMQGLGVPVWFVFQHEPEDDTATEGTSGNFRAAAVHIYDLMKPICTNCQIGTVLLKGTFTGSNGGVAAWMPNAAHLDFVGSDLYTQDGSTQLSVLADPSLTYARSVGKPYFIGEAGVGGTATKKRTWLQNARTFLKANTDIIVFDYSETNALADYRVEYQAGPLSAWQAITGDPYFQ
jgi:hypothetical protein